MFLNEYVATSRNKEKISQSSFYKGIVSRATADSFEKKNADVLKISALPIIAEKLSITINDLIDRSIDTFSTKFEAKNKEFLLTTSILSEYETENVELKDNEIDTYLKAMDNLYLSILTEKDQYSNYFNLYLLLKYSFHDTSNTILPVEKTDITILKKIFKNKKIYGTYDYKAFANIIVSQSVTKKDIEYFVNYLFPIEDCPSREIVESAYIALGNITTKMIRSNEYELASHYLELFNSELLINSSYYHRLYYMHDYYLLEFLKSKFENADALAKSLQFIDIIELCEPPESSLGARLRESTVNIVENKTSSRSIINIIASTKNNIDFKKLIPEHFIKNNKNGKPL